MIKTPSFWYDSESFPAKIKSASLSSFSALYALGHLAHQSFARTESVGIPVICIGNLVAGGTGKTPVAIAIMNLVRTEGLFKNPCFVSRGYGGALNGPVTVDPATHSARDVGDEPLLLADCAPIIIARNRADGARLAEKNGHDVIILDDGLQNPSIKKDLGILVVDGRTGFGNGLLIPAGPLRTPLKQGFKKINLAIIIGADDKSAQSQIPPHIPVIHVHTTHAALQNAAERYIGFCGIAHPGKFQDTLERANMNVIRFYSFPDHHNYTEKDMRTLADHAKTANARLVTTTKDAARLGQALVKSHNIDILSIKIEWPPESSALIRNLIHTLRR